MAQLFTVKKVGLFKVIIVDYLRQGQKNAVTPEEFVAAMIQEAGKLVSDGRPVVIVFNDAMPCAWATTMLTQTLDNIGGASMVILDTRDGSEKSCVVLFNESTTGPNVGKRIKGPNGELARHTNVAEKS